MVPKFFNYLLKNQVIFALFLIVFGWLILQIKDILISLFISYIIMAAVLPFVHYLRSKGFHKIPSVLIPYFTIIIALMMLVFPLIPFVAAQISSLATGFPRYLNQSAQVIGFEINPHQVEGYLTKELANISQNAFTVTGKVFGGFFTVMTVFIISFYLLMYNEEFKKSFAALFHNHSKTTVLEIMDKINEKLGAWLRGQVVLCIFIGLLSWIGLTLIGVPYALPLALIAGLLEVVPTLGPILAAVPAVILAVTVSPTHAIIVSVLYFFIQGLENNFLVPKIMEKAVGLNPIVVILAITIGATLTGIPGALLSIPFVSFLIVLFNSLEQRDS